MKAAVIYPGVELPEYTDVPEPTQREEFILVNVKAAALKRLDKSRATGTHYSSNAPKENGRIIGGDGVCELSNGKHVYAIGETGMMAEKALIDKNRMVPVPDGLDDVVAAALPNAVIGSAMGLKFKADIQAGDTVFINGATGFTGSIAVQLAKHYGAAKIIATGRNKQALEHLKMMGADETIQITGDDENFKSAIKTIQAKYPIDIVIDYLWGKTAETILSCLKGDGSFSNRIRYVSIGAMSGDTAQLSAEVLRSTNIQLTGSGLGAWTKEQVKQLFTEILPEAFELAAAGKLKVETQVVRLTDIAGLWDMEIGNGKRLVIQI